MERAVFAALFLACTPSAPVSEPPPLSSALLCFRLFSALSASGAPGVQQALASAAGHPDMCKTPAAVLACAGVLYSTPPPLIGDAHVGQALHQIIVHAAEAALMQDNDLSPRRAALTSSVALATSRLLASAGLPMCNRIYDDMPAVISISTYLYISSVMFLIVHRRPACPVTACLCLLLPA